MGAGDACEGWLSVLIYDYGSGELLTISAGLPLETGSLNGN